MIAAALCFLLGGYLTPAAYAAPKVYRLKRKQLEKPSKLAAVFIAFWASLHWFTGTHRLFPKDRN